MRFLIVLLFLVSFGFAHEETLTPIDQIHTDPWAYLGVPNPISILLICSLISFVAILIAVFTKLSDTQKHILFWIIVTPIAVSTLYLIASTVYMNLISESDGPVHWHADFEVWACGEKINLKDPSGLDNKIGTPVLHEHNDNRIHVEGVLIKLQEASLENFFHQVGGEFDDSILTMPTNSGKFSMKNGDLCNGKSGKWYVFVNGELINGASHYVLSPYPNIPPGDEIKFVFTEKALTMINSTLGGAP